MRCSFWFIPALIAGYAMSLLGWKALQKFRDKLKDEEARIRLRMDYVSQRSKDFAEAKATAEHADDIVNIALDTEGTVMALLAREEASGGIKCSLRALAPLRVDEIARSFGGGGHAQASGCTVAGDLGEVTQRVTAAMEKELKKQNV